MAAAEAVSRSQLRSLALRVQLHAVVRLAAIGLKALIAWNCR